MKRKGTRLGEDELICGHTEAGMAIGHALCQSQLKQANEVMAGRG